MLQYAVDVMEVPVAMGSDFNGVAGHIGPRFGKFQKQITGGRIFNFNSDGLAHVGLLPDLIADIKRIGLPKKYTDNMFRSAEKYIQMWERACLKSNNTALCMGK